MMRDLNGRVAMVTGASQGIGAAIAKALAAEGCTLALIARGKEGLDKVAEQIRQHGGTAESYPCDMSDAEAVADTVHTIEKNLGSVDVLVNNAGAGTFKPLTEMTLAEAMLPVDLPFGAAVAACHSVVPGMVDRGRGHILNLTSPAGYFPLPYMVPYTAARHAMVGLSLGLRDELAPHGIGVSLLCPSQVNTGYFERNDADLDWYPRLSKRLLVLEPEQVAVEAVKAIRDNTGERIMSIRLAAMISAYRKTPDIGIRLLKRIGLFRPNRTA